jgi:hypothetical protein
MPLRPRRSLGHLSLLTAGTGITAAVAAATGAGPFGGLGPHGTAELAARPMVAAAPLPLRADALYPSVAAPAPRVTVTYVTDPLPPVALAAPAALATPAAPVAPETRATPVTPSQDALPPPTAVTWRPVSILAPPPGNGPAATAAPPTSRPSPVPTATPRPTPSPTASPRPWGR